MHRFWLRFILPLLLAAAPRRVMEVGAEFGWNTRRLLELGREHGFFLDVVDPAPHPVFHEVLAGFHGGHAFHQAMSVVAIPELPAADFVMLDGDHNWHTVYNELTLLFLRARQDGSAPPLVLFHDMAWPYARRGHVLRCRAAIYEGNRQPHARRGFVPGRSDLTEDGLNGEYDNALHEGGPRNGVLTAVEDFIAASGLEQTALFRRLPFFNGLGILVPPERLTDAVRAAVEGFFTPDSLMQSCEELEGDVNNVRVELAVCRQHLTRRTEALMRARTIIAELEQELADAKAGKQEGLA